MELERAFALPAEEVLEQLGVDPRRGLDGREAELRRQRFGSNRLAERATESAAWILVRQFRSLVVGLLAGSLAASAAFGRWPEALAIAVVILLNAAIGFATELRAVRSMEALRRLGRVSARVRRDGQMQQVDADDLVPGDVVVIEAGDVVAADLRLVEDSRLQVDESILTGESAAASKSSEAVAEGARLGERRSMLFRGTAITRGAGTGVVVATGPGTEVGRIADLAQSARKEPTVLERRLEHLGRMLIGVTLAVAATTLLVGLLRGRDALLMVETAIALAVAAIPEGLPVVATLALARGMWRMARRHALVRRLAAVETLGATTVILCDKTGTLTENRMTVVKLALADGDVEVAGQGLETEGAFHRHGERVDPSGREDLTALLEVGALCSNASLGAATADPVGEEGRASAVGDPLEVALLVAAAKAGIRRDALLAAAPEVREEAFDSGERAMATFHDRSGGCRVAAKGAPESILAASTSVRCASGEVALDATGRRAWLDRAALLGLQGLRVLALAEKQAESSDAEPYAGLTLLGLAAMFDPPRASVGPALAECVGAGVGVVMVTGDQAGTALGVARALDIVEGDDARVVEGEQLPASGSIESGGAQRLREVRVFARIEPEQKLRLIELHQRGGAIVAMTGDGVNDAPALRKADIGIAMGRRGTDVAREAADMVLQDDSFATVVFAIRQGRVVFSNIRRFVVYLLSCNVSEILVVSAAALGDLPLPVLPLQILFLNLVTDVFPALALGFGEGDARVMQRPPRDPDEPIIARRHWLSIFAFGVAIATVVLLALVIALHGLGYTTERAVTVSFLTLGMAQMWHVFDMRAPGSRPLRNEITRNPWVWGALAVCTALLVLAVHVSPISEALGAVNPGLAGWTLALAASLLPMLGAQIVLGRPGRRAAAAASTP